MRSDAIKWENPSHRAALALDPGRAESANNLAAEALRDGRATEALILLDRASASDPSDLRVLVNRGLALLDLGRATPSVLRRVLPVVPTLVPVLVATGAMTEDREVAARWVARGAAVSPDPDTLLRLAHATAAAGLEAASSRWLRRCIVLSPGSPDGWNQIGTTVYATGATGQAASCFARAASCGHHAIALANLALTLHDESLLSGAARASRRAISLVPGLAEAHTNLANICQERCDLSASLAARHRVIAIVPDHRSGLSNLLMTLAYAGDRDTLQAEISSRWWARKGILAPVRQWNAAPVARKRLRVGYVSSFTLASTRLLALSAIERHDPANVDVVAYVSRRRGTEIPSRPGAAFSYVRDITDVGDAAAAAVVAGDQVDVLVDLCGHTPGNRLGVFAHRAAPVQITWAESFFSTGLPAMDWFLTDCLHSPHEDPAHFVEGLLRLPHIRFCFAPPEDAPPVARPPSERREGVIFGCFNYPAKITDRTVSAWAQILARVPGSRLRLKWWSFDDNETRRRFVDRFGRCGIGESRLEFATASPYRAMLEEYGQIDVALDPFPFTGGVTTCEALWMGVPVVSLRGSSVIGRQTASILTVIGAEALIAESIQEYCDIAVGLANRRDDLAGWRRTLRVRMSQSPITDAEAFARDLEAAYQQAWRSRMQNA